MRTNKQFTTGLAHIQTGLRLDWSGIETGWAGWAWISTKCFDHSRDRGLPVCFPQVWVVIKIVPNLLGSTPSTKLAVPCAGSHVPRCARDQLPSVGSTIQQRLCIQTHLGCRFCMILLAIWIYIDLVSFVPVYFHIYFHVHPFSSIFIHFLDDTEDHLKVPCAG